MNLLILFKLILSESRIIFLYLNFRSARILDPLN
nr:MAG TPA: hypothetical protein [Caudoviricetes sp.]